MNRGSCDTWVTDECAEIPGNAIRIFHANSQRAEATHGKPGEKELFRIELREQFTQTTRQIIGDPAFVVGVGVRHVARAITP